jgi:hypothetical protein
VGRAGHVRELPLEINAKFPTNSRLTCLAILSRKEMESEKWAGKYVTTLPGQADDNLEIAQRTKACNSATGSSSLVY